MSLPRHATTPSGVPDSHRKWGLCYNCMKYRPGFGRTECRRQTLRILQAMHVTWQIWLCISLRFIHGSRTCMSCWEPQWREEAFRLCLHSSTVPLIPSKMSPWQIWSGSPFPTMRMGVQGVTQTRGRTWIQAYDEKRLGKTRTLNSLCWRAFLTEVKRNGRRYGITQTDFHFSKGKKQ